jgi:hypothetical protein
MDATVTNLLDIARFSQNGIAIHWDWASIDEIIGSAIQGRRGDAAGLVFDSELRGAPALLRLDALLMEKVLCNLIDNAVRHAHGATRIAVRAHFRGRSLQVSPTMAAASRIRRPSPTCWRRMATSRATMAGWGCRSARPSAMRTAGVCASSAGPAKAVARYYPFQ